jgi:predicted RND superfamily exporter protein
VSARIDARKLAESCVRLVARFRWTSLGLLILATVLAWASYGRAVDWDPDAQPVDNGIEIWFLEDDPALLAYQEFQRTFGNDEAVLVALRDEALWTPGGLTRLAALADGLSRVPNVRGVTSLSTVLHAGSTPDDALLVERLYRGPVETPEQVAAIRARVDANPLYRHELLSDDGLTTLVSVQLERFEHEDRDRGPILAALGRVVDDALADLAARRPTEQAYALGGIGVIHDALNTIVMRGSGVLFAASGVVIALCLWLTLRRLSAVVLAMTTVGVATTLLLGVYLGLGYRLNMVTMILPTLVMVIGLTDSIYFITSWYQERDDLLASGLSHREAVVRCVGFCFLPGLFNSVTASVGFLAFASARMEVIRVMGLFAGVGILLAFATSVVVCTIGFELLDPRAPAPSSTTGRADHATGARLLAWLSGFVARRRRAILAGTALLALVSLAGVLRLNVDTYTIRYFYADHPVQKDDAWIEANYGPYLPLEAVVTGPVTQPEVLRGVDALQRRVEADPEGRVRSSVSVVGVVSRLHEVLAGPPARLPDSVEAVEQELLLWDPDRPDDPLRLVDHQLTRARLTFRTKNQSARAGQRLIDDVTAHAAATLPPSVTFQPAGYIPLYTRLIDYLVEGQLVSLTTTFLVIFVVVALLFRSLRYALLSLPANLTPVLGTLGFMGWAGIDLDASTVLIASISLGIAVDDTIHFLFKFRSLAESSKDDAHAVDETLRTTGVAIFATSLVLSLGFAVICLAEVKSVALFGLLTAVTMLAAVVAELLITPAVILTFARRRADSTLQP